MAVEYADPRVALLQPDQSNRWHVRLKPLQAFDEVLSPTWWKPMASKLAVWDRIRITRPDGELGPVDVELVVVSKVAAGVRLAR
jgi:hypothetical protein